jgi:hypothetical protein
MSKIPLTNTSFFYEIKKRKRVIGPPPRRGGARDRASPREVTPWDCQMRQVRFARGEASCVTHGGRDYVVFPLFTDKSDYERYIFEG